MFSPEPEVSGGHNSDEGEGSATGGLPHLKKIKRASKWQDEWKKYNMKPSKRGPSFVFCNICCSDFSVASGGVHELKRHLGCKKHTKLARQSACQTKITASTFRGDPLANQLKYIFLLLLLNTIYLF